MEVELTDQTSASGRNRPRRRRARALVWHLVTVYVLLTLNFLLPRFMPGDPINALLTQGGASFSFGDQTRAAMRRYYHLDGSLLSQYGHYLSRLAHGDFGRSIVTNASVWHEMSYRIPWTLLLISSSMVIATAVGSAAGVHAGWRRDRPADRTLMLGLISFWQFPPYLLGSLLIFVFSVKLAWLPLFGGQTPFAVYSGPIAKLLDICRHLALPLVVLVSGLLANHYLVMRSGMVSELGADYLMLGRAKGLRQRRLKYHYAARNALLPVVSLTAVSISSAVAANILIERTFAYPGLGNLMFQSIATRDYPVMQGIFVTLSLGIVAVNAIADFLYGRLDPRTRP